MSSWADHCSSSEDESPPTASSAPATVPENDDFYELPTQQNVDPRHVNIPSPPRRTSSRGGGGGGGGGGAPNHILPTSPPYTAFIGNLSSSVHPDDLCGELEQLARETLNAPIHCKTSRIVSSKKRNSSVGNGASQQPQQSCFGYVEMETVDDLSAVLNLDSRVNLSCNDNRRLRIQVANTMRRHTSTGSLRRSSSNASSGGGGGGGGGGGSLRRSTSEGQSGMVGRDGIPEIDGSAFRGGKFSRQGSGAGGSLRSVTATSLTRGSSVDGGGKPRERPSLKLAPRTKPRDDGAAGEDSTGKSSSQSDLFGGAKPRDENIWQVRKKEQEEKQKEEEEKQKRLEKQRQEEEQRKQQQQKQQQQSIDLRKQGDKDAGKQKEDKQTEASGASVDSKRRQSEQKKKPSFSKKRESDKKSGAGGRGGSDRVGDRRRSSKPQGHGGSGKRMSRSGGSGYVAKAKRDDGSAGSSKRGGKKNGSDNAGGRSSVKEKPSTTAGKRGSTKEEPTLTNTFAALGFDDSDDSV